MEFAGAKRVLLSVDGKPHPQAQNMAESSRELDIRSVVPPQRHAKIFGVFDAPDPSEMEFEGPHHCSAQ